MKKSTFSIVVALILSILTIILYIYTYKNGLKLIWLVFLIDRILTFISGSKFEKWFDNIDEELEGSDGSLKMSKFLIFVLIFVLVAIVMLIYILFEYPRLLALIVIGEIIDKIISNISEITKDKKINRNSIKRR